MNTKSTNNTFRLNPFYLGPYYKGILAVLAGLFLVACDSVPTETSPNLGNTSRVLDYAGPPCNTADTCTFKVEFWNKMSDRQCANCHDSNSTATQLPFFMESSDVNQAYAQTLPYVDLAVPANSTIVNKIQNRHNCGNAGACTALASNVITYIENWAQGGASTSGGEANNSIVLTPPTIRNVGTSRSFPAASTGFETTVWPLLRDNCANCHTESAPTPQSPFFAESNVDAAYAAVIGSQKINLDDPAISRLVVRLDPEFHNCWVTPTGADPTGCVQSGTLMLNAIIAFRDGIPLTEVNDAWFTSKALDLTDGILASGGARDDSSTIALYEMKTGSGNTIYDTSGVEPALNLTGSDFNWVGGWGIEFTPGVSGQARGSAQNTKLRDYIVSSGEYSIEAWIVPANVNQGTVDDPARIVTYSGGTAPTERNFTLGQAAYSYVYMNRNPNDPTFQNSLISNDADEDLQASQQHVVVTYHPTIGRKIYVNGVDVSLDDNAGAGSTDPVAPGSLAAWDDSYALILGSEAGGNDPWAGKLRLVAIHNRAMAPDQVTTNFEAGVGEKFYLMFSVSDLIDIPTTPPSDSDCFLTSAVTTSNPRGDQCFIYLEVSQFDNYSYLFYQPIFISKNDTFIPNDAIISGMRIGLNGKEPAVGQAFSNIGKSTPSLTISSGTGPYDYNVANGNTTDGEQVLSDIGTIIALEKGAGADEFFLSFEQFGTNDDGGAHDDYECLNDACLKTTPVTNTSESDIGLRTFDEINATMAALTGIDMTLPAYQSVEDTFNLVKQQLPSTDDINTFLSAHEIGIAQLAIEYCSALVDDSTKRAAYFPGFNFAADANAVSDADWQNLVITPLMDRMMGTNLATQPDPTGTLSVSSELMTLITNPLDVRLSDASIPTSNDGIPDGLAKCGGSCLSGQTELVVKATCASLLGSAVTLVQ